MEDRASIRRDFICIDGSGAKRDVRLRISWPHRSEGAWRCDIDIDLRGELFESHAFGEDALQAMLLSFRAADNLVARLEREAGVTLLLWGGIPEISAIYGPSIARQLYSANLRLCRGLSRAVEAASRDGPDLHDSEKDWLSALLLTSGMRDQVELGDYRTTDPD